MMSKPRLLFCYALLGLVVGGPLYDIATFTEHYPFSPYWMFCNNVAGEKPVVMQYRATAVPADGAAPFFLEARVQMEPWTPQRFSLALDSVAKRSDFQHIAKHAARDAIKRYEANRARHRGPPLKAMILNRVSWRVREDAANRRTPDTVEEIGRVETGESWP